MSSNLAAPTNVPLDPTGFNGTVVSRGYKNARIEVADARRCSQSSVTSLAEELSTTHHTMARIIPNRSSSMPYMERWLSKV